MRAGSATLALSLSALLPRALPGLLTRLALLSRLTLALLS